jgi:hypothetical protein
MGNEEDTAAESMAAASDGGESDDAGVDNDLGFSTAKESKKKNTSLCKPQLEEPADNAEKNGATAKTVNMRAWKAYDDNGKVQHDLDSAPVEQSKKKKKSLWEPQIEKPADKREDATAMTINLISCGADNDNGGLKDDFGFVPTKKSKKENMKGVWEPQEEEPETMVEEKEDATATTVKSTAWATRKKAAKAEASQKEEGESKCKDDELKRLEEDIAEQGRLATDHDIWASCGTIQKEKPKGISIASNFCNNPLPDSPPMEATAGLMQNPVNLRAPFSITETKATKKSKTGKLMQMVSAPSILKVSDGGSRKKVMNEGKGAKENSCLSRATNLIKSYVWTECCQITAHLARPKVEDELSAGRYFSQSVSQSSFMPSSPTAGELPRKTFCYFLICHHPIDSDFLLPMSFSAIVSHVSALSA